jgi:hypothetical protein
MKNNIIIDAKNEKNTNDPFIIGESDIIYILSLFNN